MNEIMPKEKKNPKEQIIDEHENKTDNFLKNKDNKRQTFAEMFT